MVSLISPLILIVINMADKKSCKHDENTYMLGESKYCSICDAVLVTDISGGVEDGEVTIDDFKEMMNLLREKAPKRPKPWYIMTGDGIGGSVIVCSDPSVPMIGTSKEGIEIVRKRFDDINNEKENDEKV